MMWAPHASPLSVASFDCILGSIQSFLAKLGLQHYGRAASLWVFFAACRVAELFISFLICTPLERFWPLTNWPKRVTSRKSDLPSPSRNADASSAMAG